MEPGYHHRTGLPTPAVRGRRALHGRTPPGHLLSARPGAGQRQRGAVHPADLVMANAASAAANRAFTPGTPLWREHHEPAILTTTSRMF